MKAQKWNVKKQAYEPYELPEGSYPEERTFEIDMDKEVTCAACGSKLPFVDGYTSRHIHTDAGIGYTVCKECYEKELAEDE